MSGGEERLLKSLGLWERWGNTCAPEPGVIALTGGGGKTTMMETLAREAAQAGRRALAATSTHIALPDQGTVLLFLEDCGMLELRKGREKRRYPADALKDPAFEACLFEVGGSVLTAGTLCLPETENGPEELQIRKLTSLPETLRKRLMQMVDVVFVEADGAKRLPLKLPAAHEPALEKETEAVICCAGLSALGHRAKEAVFRRELFSLGEDEPVTEQLIGRILASERGGRKNVGALEYRVILNQCDTKELEEAAGRIGTFLREMGIHGAAVCRGRAKLTF